MIEFAVAKRVTSARGALEVLDEIAHDGIMPPASRVAAAGRLAAMALEAGQLSELERKVMLLEARTVDAQRADWSDGETQRVDSDN